MRDRVRYTAVLLGTTVWLVCLAAAVLGADPASAHALPRLIAHGDGGHIVKADGSMWSIGNGTSYSNPPVRLETTASPWASVTFAGTIYGIAIHHDGTVWGWGSTSGGALGIGSSFWPNPPIPSPVQVLPGTDWVRVSSPKGHTLALNAAGEMWATGQNWQGQVGNGDPAHDVYRFTRIGAEHVWTDVAAADGVSYAVADDGSLWGWGGRTASVPVRVGADTDWHRLVDGSGVFAFKEDGTLWGLSSNPLAAPGSVGAGWSSVSAGGSHVVGIKDDGSLWTWGSNSCLELGFPDGNDRWVPTRVGNRNDWVEASAGDRHTYMLDAAGMVWAAGGNWNGQMAVSFFGDLEFAAPPIPVFDTEDLQAPSASAVDVGGASDLPWTRTSSLTPSFGGTDDKGVRGYSYVQGANSSAQVDSSIETRSSSRQFFLQQGVTYVHVRAIDYAGQPGPIARLTVRLDYTSPSTTARSRSGAGEAFVRFSATDQYSGVAATLAGVDGSLPTTVTGDLRLTGPGVHAVQYRSVDVARNFEATKTVSVTVGARDVGRLAGRDRYAAAVQMARESFDPWGDRSWEGVDHVVIASGEDRAAADPLSAAGLCGLYDAPLLLVSAASTPASVTAAVAEIAAANRSLTFHIVGGPTSVPEARLTGLKLAAEAKGATVSVDRLLSTGGRYDMAAAVAARIAQVDGPPSTVLVAQGSDPANFFDALILGPISAREHLPILLVSKTAVPPATAAFIARNGPAEVIVCGSTSAVSATVVSKLNATRWAGSDRAATACLVAQRATERGWLNNERFVLTAKVSDALAGGVVAGRLGAPLLLTGANTLTPTTKQWILDARTSLQSGWVLGGLNSITEGVRLSAKTALTVP